MSYEKSVSDHYLHGSLLNAIESALPALGKSTKNVSIEDLAPVDEFHIGGHVATQNLLDPLNFLDHDHILDVGCGLGGAARYVASKYSSRVTGIDLTPEYIDTGRELCNWVNLSNQVTLECGSALAMPFKDNTFTAAYMLHVGMNIEDKTALFMEVHRTLKPGACFAVYDIMRQNEGELAYPVPWAATEDTSKLATPEQYRNALSNAGFDVSIENNRGEFALEFFHQVRATAQANGGPPPLGLHTLMQESTAGKIQNMIKNISSGYIAPVELIARKLK